MNAIIYVGLGGACGAVARYLISLLPTKGTFPLWTLVTNLAGAVLIGFIVGMLSDDPELSPKVALFWKTGVCGGFTTFSTFSLEALTLLEKGNVTMGMFYIGASVILCLIGVYIGRSLIFSTLIKNMEL